MADVTLITSTGGRYQAFALCEKWMSRQTLRADVQWIVVDDCEPRTKCTMGQSILRPQPDWRPGAKPTLARNLLAAIPLVTGRAVAFIEDDDYYPPEYLERMLALLQETEAGIVGEAPACYYNLQTRQYRILSNSQHASLCQTVIARRELETLIIACQGTNQHIDIELWANVHRSALTGATVIGMKGLPGRPGIGTGHQNHPNWAVDTTGEMLLSFVGREAAADYEALREALIAV